MPKGGGQYALPHAAFPALRGHPLTPGTRFTRKLKMKGELPIDNQKTRIRIEIRLTQKQKEQVERAAKRCGVTTSEYLRQRALGGEPEAVLPDAFFVCCEHLDRLLHPPYSATVNAAALEVINQMNEILQRAIKGLDREYKKWQRPDSGP